MHVTIRPVAEDQEEIICPERITGAELLAILGQSSLTLVSELMINRGEAYKLRRFVGFDDKVHDLAGFRELHTRDRELFAFIAA